MASFRWSAAAVEFLMGLAEQELSHVADRIVHECEERLATPPRGHRMVRIRRPGSRRLSQVQVMLLHKRRLPFLVYYRYVPADDIVEIVAIRHGRQKPITTK